MTKGTGIIRRWWWVAVGMLLALLAGWSLGFALAAEPPKLPAPPAVIPEIRRLATIQDHHGERLLRSPLALARDGKDGDLIATSFEAGEVVILDRTGALIKRLGKSAGLVSPYGVAVDGQGRILVTEVQTGLLKILSPAGSLLDRLDLSEIVGRKVNPGRLSLDSKGHIYIVDLTGNKVLVLSPEGELIRSVGPVDYLQKGGEAPGGLTLALSGQGTAATLFTAAGMVDRSFGRHGDESQRNVSFPTGFAIDAKGRLWIADAFQHRLKVFSLHGEFLFNFGRMEEESGGFFFPVDLCFGEGGEMFVLEKGANRIQIFQVEDLRGKQK